MIFGNSKYNALGPFAILSVLTQSAIEKAQTMMEDRSNYTRYLNDSLAAWNSSMDPVLDINNMTQLNGSGIVASELHDDDFAQVRPIHIATTVMFLSGIFNVSPIFKCVLIFCRFYLAFFVPTSFLAIYLNRSCPDLWLVVMFMFSFLKLVKFWESNCRPGQGPAHCFM